MPVGPVRYRFELSEPCADAPNCFEDPDHVCEVTVDVLEPKVTATFRFASDGSCLGVTQDPAPGQGIDPDAGDPATGAGG